MTEKIKFGNSGSHLYGKLFNYCHRVDLDRFDKHLISLGFSAVSAGEVVNYNNLSLVAERTLLILPKPNSDTNWNKQETQTFVHNGAKFVLYKPLQDIREAQDLMHGEYKIGCNIGNVTVLYFNPFPFVPRITVFKNSISLISSTTTRAPIPKKQVTDQELLEMNIKNFCNFVDLRKNEKAKTVTQRQARIDNYQASILTELKEVSLMTEELKALDEFKNNISSLLPKKLEELKELSVVKKVELQEDGIFVNFGDIYIKDKNRTFFIGTIIAKIKENSIVFINEVHERSECQHPHIRGGNACFGTYTKDILKMLSELDLKKLIFTIAQYLRTYNVNSKYADIANWSERKEEK